MILNNEQILHKFLPRGDINNISPFFIRFQRILSLPKLTLGDQ